MTGLSSFTVFVHLELKQCCNLFYEGPKKLLFDNESPLNDYQFLVTLVLHN